MKDSYHVNVLRVVTECNVYSMSSLVSPSTFASVDLERLLNFSRILP